MARFTTLDHGGAGFFFFKRSQIDNLEFELHWRDSARPMKV